MASRTSPARILTVWTASLSRAAGSSVAAEQLEGECIAQNAQDSPTAGSPLADYSIVGGEGTVGPAGIIGVLVTAVLAGGLFWLLRSRGDSRSGR